MKLYLTPLCCLSLLLVSACLTTDLTKDSWIHPQKKADYHSIDKMSCAKYADKLASLQLRQDMDSPALAGGAKNDVSKGFALSSARKLKARIYDQCMRERGYHKPGEKT